ncbi:MAG TPA: DUF5317 family protein [Anaerolineae bacterium]|nr:DUF5317 family protein [Anaerolineae bacterium]
MIMITAVLALFLLISIYGWWYRCGWEVPEFQGLSWLLASFGLQAGFYGFDWLVVWSQAHYLELLMVSQVFAFIFVYRNRHIKGALWVLLGSGCNAIVIFLNGGMPITLESAVWLYGDASLLRVGEQLGNSKDMVLMVTDMSLGFLGDRWHTPGWWPWRFVYSIGDVLVLIGVAVGVYGSLQWPVVEDGMIYDDQISIEME